MSQSQACLLQKEERGKKLHWSTLLVMFETTAILVAHVGLDSILKQVLVVPLIR